MIWLSLIRKDDGEKGSWRLEADDVRGEVVGEEQFE
jgi:hypothetical protein